MKWKYTIPVILLSIPVITGSFYASSPMPATSGIDTLVSYIRNPSAQHILVAAHRGDWRNFPENSLEGVQSCVHMGVDIVETDVQQTKDGHLIIMHDKTVDRTTNGTGKVSDLTWEDIKKLNLKNAYGYVTRYKVPLLEDLLNTVKGKCFLFIDKAYKCMPLAYALVEKTATQKEALFEGVATLSQLRSDYPNLADKIQYMPRLDGDKKNIEILNYINEYINARKLVATFILGYAKENAPGIYYSKEIRQKGVSVMANALWPETSANHDDDNSIEEPANGWGWLIAHDANIICTDRPLLLINYLKEHNQHN